MTDNTKLTDLLATLRSREVQALGAGLSRRSWHEVETAYNQLRDRIDGPIAAALRTRPAPTDAATIPVTPGEGLAEEIHAVTPEMLAAYVDWEPPCELDVSRPARALGLIRAAFFAGWKASRQPTPADEGRKLLSEATLEADNARMRKALDDLQQAEAEYRLMHDRHGGSARATGRAWDLMRRAGDKARAALNTETASMGGAT